MYSRCLLALKSLFILFLGFRPSNMTCQEQLDQTCFEKLNAVNESVIKTTTDVATTTVAPTSVLWQSLFGVFTALLVLSFTWNIVLLIRCRHLQSQIKGAQG